MRYCVCMSTGNPTEADCQLGYAATGRKVHLGFPFNGQRCIQGPTIVTIVGAVHRDAGRAELVQALADAKVPVSRLCGHCFPIAIRKAYADTKALAR